LHREIGNLLRFEVKDPRLETVTVTGVRCTDDLKDATVFVAIPGEDKQKIFKSLQHAGKFIRTCIGRRCYLKYVPRLNFKLDYSLEEAARIDHLIDSLHTGKDSISQKSEPEQEAEQG